MLKNSFKYPAILVLAIIMVLFTGAVSADEKNNEKVPSEFALHQNQPNPFRAGTSISFSVPEFSYVLIEINSTVGKKVAVIADDFYPAGDYSIKWNGKDASGEEVLAGIYFCSMTAEDYQETRKMAYIK